MNALHLNNIPSRFSDFYRQVSSAWSQKMRCLFDEEEYADRNQIWLHGRRKSRNSQLKSSVIWNTWQRCVARRSANVSGIFKGGAQVELILLVRMPNCVFPEWIATEFSTFTQVFRGIIAKRYCGLKPGTLGYRQVNIKRLASDLEINRKVLGR